VCPLWLSYKVRGCIDEKIANNYDEIIIIYNSETFSMNLDMSQLRTFVAVAEHRSFSRASQELCRVQSAISQQIQKLESHLGGALFVRSRRGLQLTARGESLLSFAVRILDLNDKVVSTLVGESSKDVIRVGTSDTYASSFFTGILTASAHQLPDVQIEVHCGYSTDIWNLYQAGQLDVVLTQGCPSGIASELLHSEPWRWVCARGSRVFSQDPVPLALFTKGCSDREMALGALNRSGKNYKVDYHSTSHAGVVAALSSGCYVSAVLMSTIDCEVRVLEEVDGFPVLGSLEVSLAFRDRAPMASVGVFADIVRHHFRALRAECLAPRSCLVSV
jgi:DNA-binding transcriptional LysR family regulator